MTRRTLLIDIEIPGNPAPKKRPRVDSFELPNGKRVSKTSTPQSTVDAERRIGWEVKAALVGHGDPDDALYALECHFHEHRQNGQYADGDNCLKTVADALNGIVWIDDAQVIEHHAYMYRDQRRPRTLIRIWRLDERTEPQ